MPRWVFPMDLRRDECDPTLGCFVCGGVGCEDSLVVRHRLLGIRRTMGVHRACLGYGTVVGE